MTGIIPRPDDAESGWVANVCPPDLLRYYCVHGHYIGHRNCFPCPVCKGKPRQPRLAQRQSTGTTRRGQQGRHLQRGRQRERGSR